MVHILSGVGYPRALCGVQMLLAPPGDTFTYLVAFGDEEWRPRPPSCPDCLLVHFVDNEIALEVADLGRRP
jgi:hypothetical protein